MVKWQKGQKRINLFTYLQVLFSLLLMLVLSWLFVGFHNINVHQYEKMTVLLNDLNQENMAFQQVIRLIHRHDMGHDVPLEYNQQKINETIKQLKQVDHEQLLVVELSAYQALLQTRHALYQVLSGHDHTVRTLSISISQDLQSLSPSLSQTEMHSVQLLLLQNKREYLSSSDVESIKIKRLYQELSSQPWAQRQGMKSIWKNIHRLIVASDQVDTISQKLLMLFGTEDVTRMQNKVQYKHFEIMKIAYYDSIVLYVLSILLVMLFVIVFLHLRRTATRLHETVRDLRFQKHALDQHAIVSIADKEGHITYVNDKLVETSQYARDELLGKNHRIFKSNYHSESFFKTLWKTVTSGQTWQGDMCSQRKDKSVFWVRTTIVPFLGVDGQPHHYIAIRTDISQHKEMEVDLKKHRAQLEEQVRQRTLSLQSSVQKLKQEIQTRKEAEYQLRRSIEDAKRSVRLKSEFIANMNHELRTPLNAIIGFSDLLREGLVGPLTETQVDYINDIFDSGNRLLHLISDIMDLSKIESGMVEFEPELVIFSDVLQNSIGMVSSKAMNHHIQLNVEVEPQIEMVVLDVRTVKQVLFNLLSNAVKFTDESGMVSVRVSVEREDKKPEMLCIAIQDTGIGISQVDLPKLFESFVQLDGAIDRKFEGTGLGLSLVKQLVELHEGTIDVQSEVGVGSCFTVKIPYQTVLPDEDEKELSDTTVF